MQKEYVIVCSHCSASQVWHTQTECDSCHKRLQNWSVASQLHLQKVKEEGKDPIRIYEV